MAFPQDSVPAPPQLPPAVRTSLPTGLDQSLLGLGHLIRGADELSFAVRHLYRALAIGELHILDTETPEMRRIVDAVALAEQWHTWREGEQSNGQTQDSLAGGGCGSEAAGCPAATGG